MREKFMSNEVLKGDIEILCTLAEAMATDIIGEWPEDRNETRRAEQAIEIIERIRRNLADPTDATSLHQTRSMNKDPRSLREE